MEAQIQHNPPRYVIYKGQVYRNRRQSGVQWGKLQFNGYKIPTPCHQEE